MQAIRHDLAGETILECDEAIGRIDDALEIVGVCAGHGTWCVLVDARHLPAAFFDLRTRFAGEFLQKLQNYGVRLAAIIPESVRHGDRFTEFLREARRGRHFSAFEDRQEAVDWLVSEEMRRS